MHMTFSQMKRRRKTMISMVMRRVTQDLMEVILVITMGTSHLVALEVVLVDGRQWVVKEIVNPSPLTLVVTLVLVGVHLVLTSVICSLACLAVVWVWVKYSGFSGSGGQNMRSASSGSIENINSQFFNKRIKDQGMTWLLLFYTPSAKGYHVLESIAEDVANSLQGAVKAGKINCLVEKTLCKDLGVSPSKSSRLYVYSYASGGRGSLVEYTGDFDTKSLKTFCQDYLPRFSKRVDLRRFDFSSQTMDNLPQVLLVSTKKDTPVMWRALSGLYNKRFMFYDAEVHDASHPMLKRLGVENFPAVIGRMVNGEEHVLREGITVKDLKSGISDLRAMLDDFEKKNGR
ncbi:dnaJ protein ERDJ3A [Iris pallida]|uniref:DnaJ protein ERDJ3A n=1 Tax=Iris pallida TaxID=29817 RepID=A0AAX6G465_IRIPA|nr:dnaJ protein ERDJ3A [Iris pallida]